MFMKLKDGKSKVLTLSYDDAEIQDICLVEILDHHGIKCTFNINTGCYLQESAVQKQCKRRMTLSEAQSLYRNSNHEIAVHSLIHPHMERQKNRRC